MNERIQELIKKATVEVRSHGAFGEPERYTKLDTEKFAELIVEECLSVVKSNTYGPNGECDYGYSREDAHADQRAEIIYEEIAYHFGIKE